MLPSTQSFLFSWVFFLAFLRHLNGLIMNGNEHFILIDVHYSDEYPSHKIRKIIEICASIGSISSSSHKSIDWKQRHTLANQMSSNYANKIALFILLREYHSLCVFEFMCARCGWTNVGHKFYESH